MTNKNLTDGCTHEEIKGIIRQEIAPLERDFKQIRAWLLGLVSFLVFSMFAMGVWVGAIDNRVEQNTAQHKGLEERVDAKLGRIEDLLLQLTREISSIK
jgi:hypothetical protein